MIIEILGGTAFNLKDIYLKRRKFNILFVLAEKEHVLLKIVVENMGILKC